MAHALLGCVLVRRTHEADLRGRIVEVESYGGSDDPGSHAYRGPTARNRVMFGPPGHAYVYRIYHFHHCLNVVCGRDGEASAVLIRSLEPLAGIEQMERNRSGRPLLELCSGPGKLCQALQISLADNGTDLEGDRIWIESGNLPGPVAASTRVGLRQGRDVIGRFYLADNPFVSRGKPSAVPAQERPSNRSDRAPA